MNIVVASDERTKLTDTVIDYLKSRGHNLLLMGAIGSSPSDKWVEIGKGAAHKVVDKKVERGIIFCWSGTGICMAANKVYGARAALCHSAEIARLSRKWDDANILVMALVDTKQEVAKEIIDAFLQTGFNEEGLDEAYKLDE